VRSIEGILWKIEPKNATREFSALVSGTADAPHAPGAGCGRDDAAGVT
jgi:hypothetical protein